MIVRNLHPNILRSRRSQRLIGAACLNGPGQVAEMSVVLRSQELLVHPHVTRARGAVMTDRRAGGSGYMHDHNTVIYIYRYACGSRDPRVRRMTHGAGARSRGPLAATRLTAMIHGEDRGSG